MRWVLLWSVLLIAAGVFLTLIARRLWHQLKSVKADLGAASRRMSAVSPGRNDPPNR